MPLDGVLVADFSRVLAGPLATTILADLGATVIKVERSGSGDDTRRWGPPWTGNSSSYFHAANRSKKSIELDLDDPDDLALAGRLARRADVMVENFLEGALARRGLAYHQLRDDNPGLVYCSVSGFGSRDGAGLPGYDFLVQALGGLMSITGPDDGEPQKVGVALVDVLTSKDAVIGILAALQARTVTGRGQRVEVNLLTSLLGSMANQVSSLLTTGRAPQRMGNRHPSIAPYETLHARDGLVAVACGNDGQFRRLAGVLGDESLALDQRFVTNPARVEHRVQLVARLEALMSEHDVDALVDRLLDVGVPAGKVGDLESALRLAGDLGLDPTVQVGDDVPSQVRHPIDYSETPVLRYAAPPRLGEHNDEMREWLQADP